MTASQILSITREKGIELKAQGDQLAYKAPIGALSKELIEQLRDHKAELLNLLTREKSELSPGECETCPAGGFWDWKGAGLWCFHSAYFEGKAKKPSQCVEAKRSCPLNTGKQKKLN